MLPEDQENGYAADPIQSGLVARVAHEHVAHVTTLTPHKRVTLETARRRRTSMLSPRQDSNLRPAD